MVRRPFAVPDLADQCRFDERHALGVASGKRCVEGGFVGVQRRQRRLQAGQVSFGEPGADWLLLGPGVQLRHTSYDLTTAAERIRESDYPEADDFVARYLLQPPAEDAMLKAFAHAEWRSAR